MRSKGMLVWNAATQLEYVYTTFVDAVALDAIGKRVSTHSSSTSSYQLGYKYYAAYIPLVVIQWVLVKRCECSLDKPWFG
jgi:SP family sugar:H+ symporter-like MFS transporter